MNNRPPSKLRTTAYILAMLCTVAIIITLLTNETELIKPIETKPHTDMTDSLKSVIRGYKDRIDSLEQVKEVVKIKYQRYYVYLDADSAIFDELLFEHGLLDDSIVSYEDDKLLAFRLIQGLEARGENKINRIQLEHYKLIYEESTFLHELDSIQIDIMARGNMKCVDAHNTVLNDLNKCNDKLQGLSNERRGRWVKMVGAGVVGFVIGSVVGLMAD
jgi:hypothetical protein